MNQKKSTLTIVQSGRYPSVIFLFSMAFLQLTLARDNDLEAIALLDQRCLDGLWSLDQYAREQKSDKSDIVVARLGDQILAYGCVWSILEEAHITILAVDPQFQRRGLGRLILWGLMECAMKRGLERSTLEVKETNLAALGLYQTYGFMEAGRRPKYYNDGSAALILWLNHLQYPAFLGLQRLRHQQIQAHCPPYGWDLIVSLDTDVVADSPLTGGGDLKNNHAGKK
jgi:[ribosomal protein S18]-alanine N-acetyltransferase